MSRPTTEDQYQFLLSCVQHSKYGKVDFASVSQDLNITGRGAAAKRYNRLSRLYGVNSKTGKNEQDTANKRKSKASIARAAEAKRRKLEGDHNDPLADEGAVGIPVKSEPGIKQERMSFSVGSTPWNGSSDTCQEMQHHQLYNLGSSSYGIPTKSARPRIKIEEDGDGPSKCFGGVSSSSAYDADDERIFDDFCNSELFDSGEDAAPAYGNLSKDVGGASSGLNDASRDPSKETNEVAQQGGSARFYAKADDPEASHGVVGVAAGDQAIRDSAAGGAGDTAAATQTQASQDVIIVLD